MRGQSLVIFAALAAIAAGCDHVPDAAIVDCRSDVHVAPARTDILVVVDDSRSMAEEQENLRQNLASFVHSLATSAIPHDVQIGVTTTSVDNTHGMTPEYPYFLPPYGGLEIPFPRGRLVAVDPRAVDDPALRGLLLYDEGAGGFIGPRILEMASPTVVDDFGANVLVGTHGSDKEEPLRAVELALTDRIVDGTNAGFLRPGARLAVIILTDEDDCSETASPPVVAGTNELCHFTDVKKQLESVTGFADFLRGPIAGEVRDPILAVIAGFDPGCKTVYDRPARFTELLDAMDATSPSHTFRGDICDPSFGPSLQRIAEMLVPQTVALEGTPPDVRMLVASVRRGAETVSCTVAPAGSADAAQAGAVYNPPQGGRPASLTFQRECSLQAGDEVKLSVICAG